MQIQCPHNLANHANDPAALAECVMQMIEVTLPETTTRAHWDVVAQLLSNTFQEIVPELDPIDRAEALSDVRIAYLENDATSNPVIRAVGHAFEHVLEATGRLDPEPEQMDHLFDEDFWGDREPIGSYIDAGLAH